MVKRSDDQAVRAVQIWMRDLGLYSAPIDGDWGPLSEKAWNAVKAGYSGQTPAKPADPLPRSAGGLVRIIMHWTASSYGIGSNVDHYHFVFDGEGEEFPGKLKPEDNISVSDKVYTPHALNANTGAVGVAIACMAGAKERPFSWGPYPIRQVQVDAMCRKVASLAAQYGIPIDRRTVLTHAEVQPTLGIRQNGKWDISVLPGMDRAGNAIEIGDTLREQIRLAA